jgi:hypothetical protein
MKIANEILVPELARLLAEEKEVRFTPSGNSMRPFIEGNRDSVILAPLTRSPRRGDILLVRAIQPSGQTTYVLHRLVRIAHDERGELLVLQGDGNLQGEETCRSSDVIGRVRRIESPKGRAKLLTRGILWHALLPIRGFLLKVYRHTVVPLYRDTEK